MSGGARDRGQRPLAITGLHGADDSDDDDENSVGAQRVLARLGVAMARANRNDDAAVALRQAVLMDLPAGTEDAELAFEARENLGMVVNRLFQPLDAYMALNHRPWLEALRKAVRKAIPQRVIDVGGGACAGLAALLAAEAGAELVVMYEPFKVRAAVVRDIVKANSHHARVKIVEQDLLDQPAPAPMQAKHPADLLALDMSGHFGCDLLNSPLVPTVRHARDAGFLAVHLYTSV